MDFAFKFNWRRYNKVSSYDADACAHFPTAWCAGGCDSGVGTEVRHAG